MQYVPVHSIFSYFQMESTDYTAYASVILFRRLLSVYYSCFILFTLMYGRKVIVVQPRFFLPVCYFTAYKTSTVLITHRFYMLLLILYCAC